MSDPIGAIHWKQNHAPGLRIFGDAKSAIHAGEDPVTLYFVRGVLVKWPATLGAPPNDATVATWEIEYDAFLAAAQSDLDTFTKHDQAILVAAALLAGVNPVSAKAQAKAKFQEAMGLLP